MPDHKQCQNRQKQEAAPGHCFRPFAWMRIQDGEVLRPKEFPQIASIRDERVFHSQLERQPVRLLRDSQAFMRKHGQQTRGNCQRNQRKFFQHEDWQFDWRELPLRSDCWKIFASPFRPSQRPHIKQEHRYGQRHQDRFAHQTHDEQHQNQRIPSRASFPHVPAIRQQR